MSKKKKQNDATVDIDWEGTVFPCYGIKIIKAKGVAAVYENREIVKSYTLESFCASVDTECVNEMCEVISSFRALGISAAQEKYKLKEASWNGKVY